jgi:hypothetical protein
MWGGRPFPRWSYADFLLVQMISSTSPESLLGALPSLSRDLLRPIPVILHEKTNIVPARFEFQCRRSFSYEEIVREDFCSSVITWRLAGG